MTAAKRGARASEKADSSDGTDTTARTIPMLSARSVSIAYPCLPP